MTDAVLADVAAIESIAELDLSASHGVTDEGLRHLAKLPRLRVLNLSKTSITDRGLRVLRDLPALESLSVSLTGITDEGAAHLAACPALRSRGPRVDRDRRRRATCARRERLASQCQHRPRGD